MNSPPDHLALLRADKLDDAIVHLNGEVKANPVSVERRALLAELLCVAGNLERADTVLDAIVNIDPSSAVGVALFRQLVRSEQARQQLYAEGRLPEFVAPPDALLQLELRAVIALREGRLGELSEIIAARDEARTLVPGIADEVPFTDFRDLDDLCASHMEVFTSTGKYFWIPVSSIVSLELRKPQTRRDLLWRPASLGTIDGPDGDVFLPTIYVDNLMTGAHRLGHFTEYVNLAERTAKGRGLRTFLLGPSSKTILELDTLTFSHERHAETD